jgi:hypothetical protein
VNGVIRVLTCEEVRDLAGGFVLDALAADEAEAVRAHLAGCADPHVEIADLASGLPALWETIALVEPPATLKSRLLAAAAADLQATTTNDPAARGVAASDGLPAAPADDPADGGPTPITEYLARHAARPTRTRARLTLGWAAGLAAVLAIVLLGAWTVVLQGQVGALRTEQDSLAAVLRAGAAAGSLTAVLTAPQAGGPVGLAALSPDGTLVLAMRDLPCTTGAAVYQAWVIVPGSAPAPTGSFRVGESGVGSIPAAAAPVAPGAMIAITLERGPGATTPTLPILASGATPTRTN